jgi:hypothetical protein
MCQGGINGGIKTCQGSGSGKTDRHALLAGGELKTERNMSFAI